MLLLLFSLHVFSYYACSTDLMIPHLKSGIYVTRLADVVSYIVHIVVNKTQVENSAYYVYSEIMFLLILFFVYFCAPGE